MVPDMASGSLFAESRDVTPGTLVEKIPFLYPSSILSNSP